MATSSLHAQAINLARRHSIRNENDLLQQDLFDDDDNDNDEHFSAVTEKFCTTLLDNNSKALPPGYELPADCHRFQTFRASLQRRTTRDREDEERAAAIAFQGMPPNETLEAIRAREHGLPHHAQIKRRMTSHNPHKPKQTTWF